MGMRTRWWRFGWHPTLGAIRGPVTFHAHDGRSETWTHVVAGVWWMTSSTIAPAPSPRENTP